MTKERKYESYKILITYSNGDTEEINYNGINTSNYTEMIKVYQAAKDQYSSESVTIDFIGTNSDGSMKIFFTKKFKTEEENSPEDEVTEKTTKDILLSIAESIRELKTRENDCKSRMGMLDKRQDVELHKIEHFNNNSYTKDEQKVKIFDEIQKIRQLRRGNKNQLTLTTKFFQLKGIDLDLATKIENLIGMIDRIENTDYEYLTDKKAEDLKIMKRIPYKNDMERIKLTSQLQKQYNHVYADSETNEVVGYNTAKKIAR